MFRRLLAGALLLLPLCGEAAQISYFTIDPIPEAQIAGTPFNLTVTARDDAGVPVTDFSGPVNFQIVSASVVSSQPLIGNLGYTDFSFNQNGGVSAGFAFIPINDLT